MTEKIMIEITSEIYEDIARNLRAEMGEGSYFNGKVEVDTEEFYATLTLTAIVYRRAEELPEGSVSRIADVVPVWWEFSTVQECGEVLNNFSFAEFKPYIIEYR
jgi:hypothetical protein